VIVGALGGKIGGGTFEGGSFTAAFGYLFNDVGGRKNPAQGALAVVEVEKRLIAEGWTPLGGQTRAAIDGLPERRYDLTMKSPDGVEFGIEVKSTIRATFKLDSQQVAFDAMTMDKGALVLSGPLRGQMIRNVLYVGYGFEGARDAVFATKVLQLTLDRMGIQTRVAGSVGGVK
jgi:hypothetical protein